MRFIHLHVHSAYSLCEGAIKTKNIAKLCEQFNMPAVAMTDNGNLFGALEFSLACSSAGIQPIIGSEITLENDAKLILLVTSHEGYQNLSKIVSRSYTNSTSYKRVLWKDLKNHNDGIIAIAPFHKSFPPLKKPDDQIIYEEHIKNYHDIFKNNFYMGIMRHGNQNSDFEEKYIDIAYDLNLPIVAINDVYFATKDMYEAQDALLCIGQGRYTFEDDRVKLTPDHYFKSQAEMIALFEDLPEAIENTEIIAKKCQFLLQPVSPNIPVFEIPESFHSVDAFFKHETQSGLKERLKNVATEKHSIYFERLERETEVITKMGFQSYFLIVADFIGWARANNIPVGPGRGSGAGSLVAWSLKITNIDPIRYDLIFERFLNPERVSMPDFDIDFCQYRRDEVINYVKQKYGASRVAHIITFGKLQARAALRDVGRVLQVPYPVVDRLCKMIPNNPASPTTIEEAVAGDMKLREEIQNDPQIAKMFEISTKIEGLYRHASTHAAGVVIGYEDLENIVPLYQEEESNIASTQFSMKYVEQAGLLKFDFLGLKTLTVIEHCSNILRHKEPFFDISNISIEDQKTFDLLTSSLALGIFQIEGGMRQYLKELKPNCLEDLIALNALYRPGPMDEIPKYLARKNGKEEIIYLHPKLEPILNKTYGVIVYQEQVMQIARDLAGYSLGGADLLRRAMGKKIKSEMDLQRQFFIDGCVLHKVDKSIAEQIFDTIAKFADYAFPKGHAAPYALISYQTAYLKANYICEFFASLMTLDCQNTDKIIGYFNELRLFNIKLLPPCINKSFSEFTVENGAIRFGFLGIKNLGEGVVDRVVEERQKNGDYKNLTDFFERVRGINKRQIEFLAAAGSFDALHKNRNQIYSSSEYLVKFISTKRNEFQKSLFEEKEPLNLMKTEDWPLNEKCTKEEEALGFYLSKHPLDLYKPFMKALNINSEIKMDQTVSLVGIIKEVNNRISKTGKKFAFVGLSTLSSNHEVLVFSEQLERYNPFKGEVVIMTCNVTERGMTCVSIEDLKSAVEKLPVELDLDIERGLAFEIKKGKTPIYLRGEYKDHFFDIHIPNGEVDLEEKAKYC